VWKVGGNRHAPSREAFKTRHLDTHRQTDILSAITVHRVVNCIIPASKWKCFHLLVDREALTDLDLSAAAAAAADHAAHQAAPGHHCTRTDSDTTGTTGRRQPHTTITIDSSNQPSEGLTRRLGSWSRSPRRQCQQTAVGVWDECRRDRDYSVRGIVQPHHRRRPTDPASEQAERSVDGLPAWVACGLGGWSRSVDRLSSMLSLGIETDEASVRPSVQQAALPLRHRYVTSVLIWSARGHSQTCRQHRDYASWISRLVATASVNDGLVALARCRARNTADVEETQPIS